MNKNGIGCQAQKFRQRGTGRTPGNRSMGTRCVSDRVPEIQSLIWPLIGRREYPCTDRPMRIAGETFPPGLISRTLSLLSMSKYMASRRSFRHSSSRPIRSDIRCFPRSARPRRKRTRRKAHPIQRQQFVFSRSSPLKFGSSARRSICASCARQPRRCVGRSSARNASPFAASGALARLQAPARSRRSWPNTTQRYAVNRESGSP